MSYLVALHRQGKRVEASLCYARQRTTDNGQRRAKPAFGITELRRLGIMEIGFALLRRTTDNRQRTTEGKAGSLLMARSSWLTAQKILQHYKRSDTIFFLWKMEKSVTLQN